MHLKKKLSKGYYIALGIFVLVFIIYIIGFIWRVYYKAPYFLIYINPAHGGKYAVASENDGDRFDPVNKKYTMDYQEGHTLEKMSEYKVLSELSKMIRKKLLKTKSPFNWGKFERTLVKYGQSKNYKRIILDSYLVKEYDHKYYSNKGKKDINRYFRLFDYPSHLIFKKWEKVILSDINKYKQELVLNLELNY